MYYKVDSTKKEKKTGQIPLANVEKIEIELVDKKTN